MSLTSSTVSVSTNQPITKSTVFGFVRTELQYEISQIIPDEIIMICYAYYGHDFITSLILNGAERDRLWHLLLSKQPNLIAGTTRKRFTASQDGFDSNSFYSKCSNLSPSILVIRSNWGSIFGAFTSIPWKIDEGYSLSNIHDTFLFSLSNNRIFEIKERDLEYAVYHGGRGAKDLDSDLIFYFGAAAGLLVYDNCDQRDDNFAYGGHKCGYEIPSGNMLCGGNQRNSDYTDKFEFRVENYELFTVDVLNAEKGSTAHIKNE